MVEQTERANNRANTRDMPSPASLGLGADLGRPALTSLTRTAEWYAKTLLTWQNEIVRFAAARLGRGIELGRSLMDCRTWTDASRAQQDWAVSTLEDYADETSRLIQLATGLENEGAEIIRAGLRKKRMAQRGMRGARRAFRGFEEETEQAAEMAETGARESHRTAKAARSSRPRRTAKTARSSRPRRRS
jgi:hypothetical protein